MAEEDMMRARRALAYVALVAAAWLVPESGAVAGKPGGGGSAPPGTIYFRAHGVTNGVSTSGVYSMNADGDGKRLLIASPPPGILAQSTRASRLLHGGKRWFLRTEVVPGEAGLQGGTTRYDLFAHREDAALSVRLTSDPTLDFRSFQFWDWCPDESSAGVTIAGPSRRWTGTSSTDSVVPGSAGVYTAHLSFDASGNVVGLDAQPSFSVSVGTWNAGGAYEVADTTSLSWSPDMSHFACDRRGEPADIRVVHAGTGEATVVVPPLSGRIVKAPCWSPDGSKVAFERYDYSIGADGLLYTSNYAVETIAPTGASRMAVVTGTNKSPGVGGPRFSPDSAWIVFWRSTNPGVRSADGKYLYRDHVWRVPATGGSAVSLTMEVEGNTYPVDWR